MKTERGEMLVWSMTKALTAPVLTVTMTTEWRELFVVDIDGKVRPIAFGVMSNLVGMKGPIQAHQAVNPMYVKRLAVVNGWEIDKVAEELIAGRWRLRAEPWHLQVSPLALRAVIEGAAREGVTEEAFLERAVLATVPEE